MSQGVVSGQKPARHRSYQREETALECPAWLRTHHTGQGYDCPGDELLDNRITTSTTCARLSPAAHPSSGHRSSAYG